MGIKQQVLSVKAAAQVEWKTAGVGFNRNKGECSTRNSIK
jgi:hypothetical protein